MAETEIPSCVKCEHLFDTYAAHDQLKCTRPEVVQKGTPKYHLGESVATKPMLCILARTANFPCGPTGKYFTPRSKK